MVPGNFGTDNSFMATAEEDHQIQINEEAFKEGLEDLKGKLESQRWRLNNLYYIVNDKGERIKFRLNYAQKMLYLGFHYCNLVLKSRQHGITTFICILYLDICLFNSDMHAAIIAHNKEDAQDFFDKKIKFAYDNLPEWLKAAIPSKLSSSKHLSFDNGSSIRVTTSGRSGTYQLVHISEFGKMCAKFPHKAKEVISGTLNTVHPGMFITIESTAEGREGHFYDMAQEAMRVQLSGRELSKMDYKFFFFGWQENDLNNLDEDVPIPSRLAEYFEEIVKKTGRGLNKSQIAWYVSKEKVQGDMMKQEHPSTPEEAFEASLEGSYFYRQMNEIRRGRHGGPCQITSVPVTDGVLVNTYWDLGMNDIMAIWFAQRCGGEIHVVDYYENSGEGLAFYKDILDQKGYRYGFHWAPHDIVVRELGTGKTRLAAAQELGINFRVSERLSKESQIQAARSVLPICWFDEQKTEKGVAALDWYRKEWNDKLGTWGSKPLHDWASNAADAFMNLSINIDFALAVDVGPPVESEEQQQQNQMAEHPDAWT